MLKKVVSTVILVMFAVSAISLSVGAVADIDNSVSKNNGDTRNIFHFIGGGTYISYVTPVARVKEDSSSAYMKCVSSPYVYYAWVYGSMSENPWPHTDVSNGMRYAFHQGQSLYMSNYAHEWGYPYAGIEAQPSTDAHYDADTLWSPDSI